MEKKIEPAMYCGVGVDKALARRLAMQQVPQVVTVVNDDVYSCNGEWSKPPFDIAQVDMPFSPPPTRKERRKQIDSRVYGGANVGR